MTPDVSPTCCQQNRTIEVRSLQLAVTQHFDVAPTSLMGKSHKSEIVHARHVAMWLMRQRGRSYSAIGRLFGRRHSSTVFDGIRKIEQMMEHNAEFAAEVRRLQAEVEAP